MTKKLPVEENKDIIVSWIYVWSKQQEMSINEQRVILRILEFCQSELKGIKIKDYMCQLQHGLRNVDLEMPISHAFFSDYKPVDVENTLRKLRERTFEYKDPISGD